MELLFKCPGFCCLSVFWFCFLNVWNAYLYLSSVKALSPEICGLNGFVSKSCIIFFNTVKYLIKNKASVGSKEQTIVCTQVSVMAALRVLCVRDPAVQQKAMQLRKTAAWKCPFRLQELGLSWCLRSPTLTTALHCLPSMHRSCETCQFHLLMAQWSVSQGISGRESGLDSWPSVLPRERQMGEFSLATF